jgi:molecular chaperone GrpE
MTSPDTSMPDSPEERPNDDPDRDAAEDSESVGGDDAPPTGPPPAAEDAAAPLTPEAEIARLRDRWLRTEAELQNYRRRAQRDLEEARRGAEEQALLDTIGFLDDLERALAAAHETKADAAWVKGIELVAQRMRDSLARAGVTAVSPVSEPFDPRFHEALIELPAPENTAAGTVLHVERTGYRRGDRVLRPARVTVAAEPTRKA